MKIKTIDLSKTTSSSHSSRRNKCWTSYHKCLNHRKCNRLMSIFFCVSILTLFIGLVVLTIVRTEVTTQNARTNKDDTCDCCYEFGAKSFQLQNEVKLLNDVQEPECTFNDCKITCRFVADESLSSLLISSFASELSECSDIELSLFECSFDDGIKEKWMSDFNVQISKLEIINSNLKFILTDAFNSDVFRASLVTLTIDNGLYDASNPLIFQLIGKGSFQGLTSLRSLTINNHPTLSVLDKNAFEHLADSLTQLKISKIASSWKPTSLLNSVQMKQLTTVNLQFNNIPMLNSSSFKGIAKYATTLSLSSSQIETILEKTFDGFIKLQFLYLQNNLLKTIPLKLFDNLLTITGFSVTISNNPWNCECELEFLQEMILENQMTFLGNSIKCETPSDLKNVDLIFADFCPEPVDTTLSHSISSASMTEDSNSNSTMSKTTEVLTTSRQTANATEPTTEATTKFVTTISTNAPTNEPTNATDTEPTTEPPVTNPPTTEPCTTEPPVTNPPTIEPTTKPPATEAPTPEPMTKPPATEAPTPEPMTEPPATEAPTPEPTTEPPTPEVPTTEPTTEPSVTEAPTPEPTTEPPATYPPNNTTTRKSSDPPTYPEPPGNTTTTTEITTSDGSTTDSSSYLLIEVECYRGTVQSRIFNWTFENSLRDSRISSLASNQTLSLIRPTMSFRFKETGMDSDVEVVFDETYDLFLVYFPGFIDVSYPYSEDEKKNVHCQIVATPNILIKNLIPSTVYTFCALKRYHLIQSPFQCKSYQSQTPFKSRPWIYQGQKVVVLSSFLLLLLLSLVVGIIMTYFLIRRIPTLMKGSKRVVLVSNGTKNVMVMPKGSRNNSCQKEASVTAMKNEAPTYMTPLPRQSFDNKPPFVRSLSDSSLRSARSYVCTESVSRSPPRFSQVFQPSDFKHELPKRCGSFPHCQPPSSCHSPDPIPPPLPRRSIASSASSFEMRKPSSNSIYRRQPSRINDETENHYNFII